MTDLVTQVEELLCRTFLRRYAILVGRGASALALLFDALTPEDGRVVLPAIACPSLLASVLLTGRKPVIVDVDENLSIDPREVARTGNAHVVVGIHLYGIPFDVEKVQEACRAVGAVLIEDAAQAAGGRLNERPLGSFGKASVLSFSRGKNLPTAGGGAILTDDPELAESLREAASALPKRPHDIEARAKALRDELTVSFNRARRTSEKPTEWETAFLKYGDIYRYSVEPSEIEIIGRALDRLEEEADRRIRKVREYEKLLGNAGALRYPPGCCPFRFTLVLRGLSGTQVQDCTEAVRAKGLHASNLYLPLHWLAPRLVETQGCPRAEEAGVRLLNLWVDDSVTQSQIETAARVVRQWAPPPDQMP